MCDGPEQFTAGDELFNLGERIVSYFPHFVMETVCLGKGYAQENSVCACVFESPLVSYIYASLWTIFSVLFFAIHPTFWTITQDPQ